MHSMKHLTNTQQKGGDDKMSKQLSHEEFLKKVKDQFKEKITVKRISIASEDADSIRRATGLTKEQIENYPPQAWITSTNDEYLCPKCNASLLGLFGSFKWEIKHGYGFCNSCKKVGFQLYHYIVKDKKLGILSVSSF